MQCTVKPEIEDIKSRYRDFRSLSQIQEHYVLERALADKLRGASRADRRILYSSVYDELFAKLPHHPQFTRHDSGEAYISKQAKLLNRLVPKGVAFLEIGAGDAKLAMAMASSCSFAHAIDVSDSVFRAEAAPENFRFSKTDGVNMPFESNSIDFAYSNQLMEHLHPDDAAQQLVEIHRVLKPGGYYLCITPSRISGPHDVSRYFDQQATGLHLVEYSYETIRPLLLASGFASCRAVIARGGRYLGKMPISIAIFAERLISGLPASLKGPVTRSNYTRAVLGVNALARKA